MPPQLDEAPPSYPADLPDPRVTHYLDEFESRYPQIFSAVAHEPERLCWLRTIFGSSRFLSEQLLRNPDWILTVDELQSTFAAEKYKTRFDEFLHEARVDTASAQEFALFRRKELLRITLRDRLQRAPLPVITEELSNLADAILDRALASVIRDLESRYGAPCSLAESSDSWSVPFSVIALGKLGGRELNYSSDIDLMFIYGGNGETSGPHKITNREFFKKVANQLTNLLSSYTAAGICYRVDLRLRPEGSLGEVCVSIDAAQEYYSMRARDWELQMLIKARTAAGDEGLGRRLFDFVEPFIYSTSLDFSTIETMSETRDRIAEKLSRKKLRKDDLDVKLAPGGIRDIEFLVQCLQRLHGARESGVRNGGTLLALSRLRDKDLLSQTEHSRLQSAYCFLRYLEHLLQLEDDRQTHSLPSEPADLERIARRMGPALTPSGNHLSASAELLRNLNQHLEDVQTIYDRIVHAQRPLQYTPVQSVAPFAIDTSAKADEHVGNGISPELVSALVSKAPEVANFVRGRGILRSEGKLAAFLERLLNSPQQLQLINDHPFLAEWLVQIFELSPYLADQISRSPELLEDIRRAADHPNKRWAFEGLAAPLNDLDGLRRFLSREMLRIQVGSVCLPEPIFQTLDSTSALAEFVIARAYRVAHERGLAHARSHATPEKPFQEPQNEMMVVALGRLGMREFDLGSDADVLFIIPDSEAPRQRFWTRVAEHLIEMLTEYSGAGTLLSLDTRLRPNGREGMLVQTESKYVEYFANKAEAWEGIAYMKARGVAGDIDRATNFLNELQQVDWRRYGQGGRSKQDLRQMRLRLQREQGQVTPLKAAEGGYYDADFILMYLRLKGAGLFYKSLNTPERIDIVEKMGHLERTDAEFLEGATKHFRALDHAVRIVAGRAEERLPGSPERREMIVELMYRWTGKRTDPANLDSELLDLQLKMRRLFDRVFGPQ
jgi:glutamate-ammonia-ligase adenylyltransferase